MFIFSEGQSILPRGYSLENENRNTQGALISD